MLACRCKHQMDICSSLSHHDHAVMSEKEVGDSGYWMRVLSGGKNDVLKKLDKMDPT